MFDTHCHLNFKSFNETFDEVILQSKKNGISYIVIPGTDIISSTKAIEIASQYDHIFAAVGIHPHHVKEYRDTVIPSEVEGSLAHASNDYANKLRDSSTSLRSAQNDIAQIEQLLQSKKVVAVGEIGMDRHEYQQTKYEDTSINEEYIQLQEQVLRQQIRLAIQYKKSLILHNREAKQDMIPILTEIWDRSLEGRTVFHCCEADEELLDFAKNHKMFLGVDGDISWSKKKQRFIKEVPLDMLVVETDSPFLTPLPLRSLQAKRGEPTPINTPSNLRIICEKVAEIKGVTFETIASVTEENGKKLFRI